MNYFEHLWGAGYTALVPIIPPNAPISDRSNLARRIAAGKDDRGKVPGIRWPDGSWSGLDWLPYTADERDIQRWHDMGAGTGIKTGHGIALIDADTLDEAKAATILKTVKQHFGDLPIRIGRYPKAGYVIACDDTPYMRIEFGEHGEKRERVEILSNGRQFVAHGLHPSGAEYKWVRPLPHKDQLKRVSRQQLEAFMADLRTALPNTSEVATEGAEAVVDQAALKGDIATITKAVNATPNTSEHFPSRESYRDFGYAIKAALPDHPNEALALFQDWCARWQDGENDPRLVEADWRRMKPPYRIGAERIYRLATEIGNGDFNRAEQWFDEKVAAEQPPILKTSEAFFVPDGSTGASHSEGAGRYAFEDFGAAADKALSSGGVPLIKGLLDQGAMSILYGDSNVGKTFVAMDLAYHVATGKPYGGLKTAGGLVVYVASEGGLAARKRLAALRGKYGGENVSFLLLAYPLNLRDTKADISPFIEALRAIRIDRGPIALVVLDTLSRVMAGGDENSSVDMGALVRHFDAIRAGVGSHLMVVHHTGKDKARGARGHSLLRAATDTELEVAEGVISVTKQRDQDKAWSAAFTLASVVLGLDGEGDPVTSCTVGLDLRPERARKAELTDEEKRVQEALRKALDAKDGTDGKGDERRAALAEIEQAYTILHDNVGREKIRFHLRNLILKGVVGRIGRDKYADILS